MGATPDPDRMRALLFTVLLAASGAMAQGPPGPPPSPDSTSAWRYFPLHLGDAWQYRVDVASGEAPDYSYTLTRRVEAYTVVDGRTYAVIREWPRDVPTGLPAPEARRYLTRFDTLAARVITREIGSASEVAAPCSLSEPFPRNPEEPREVTCQDGSLAMVSGSYTESVRIGEQTYMLTAKTISTSGTLDLAETFAADVGLVQSEFEEAEARTLTLVTARIEGRFYGDAPEAGFPGIPDTTDAARYYPLGVGDVWHYQTCDPLFGCTRFDLRSVVREELISDTLYAVVENLSYTREGGGYVFGSRRESLVRFDSATTQIADRTANRDLANGCPLGADFGVRIDTDECLGIAFREEDPVFGDIKAFDTLGGGIAFAVDIGVVGSSGDGSSALTELVYYNVGGTEQGTPIPVASGAVPEAQPLALTAFPNPTAGPLAVEVVGARGLVQLEAFDALGRRVLSREVAPEARIEIDASWWAPGLYILRAASGEETATTQIVRR